MKETARNIGRLLYLLVILTTIILAWWVALTLYFYEDMQPVWRSVVVFIAGAFTGYFGSRAIGLAREWWKKR